MPTPATAPPSVMVFSCGTTAGMTPCARQAAARASYGIIPSVSTQLDSMERTSLKCRTSSLRRATASRSRNRFDVSFASPTGPAPALSCAARASFFLLNGLGKRFAHFFVEEAPAHGVGRHGDVALAEHDLEEMRVAGRRAEHLGAAVEVDAPDAPEALVEALRVERLDARPVLVEALAPRVERERVVPAQVLDVEHLEPGLLHLDDHVGEAGDPAAGEDVLADEVVGLEVADVADEVDEAEAARLERARVRADEIGERVAPGVLEAADGDHLVVLAVHAAEVRFPRLGLAQAEALDLAPRVLHLRARRVVAGDLHAEVLLGVHQEAAEARADVDHVVARGEQHLARHV